ncbi:hypothetical protein HQ45_07880 [Porphyromonas crevioricanis]|nr:hypothetical protein HQ45_07880 [Porphyromonas crevioricanis]GAD06450.1 hypothetical protein PORCAN_46 [Porphyromonas crevioricanis JCM 13913]SQH72466.1 Uncharacterised protein [Porphyromonas crevioricanis]
MEENKPHRQMNIPSLRRNLIGLSKFPIHRCSERAKFSPERNFANTGENNIFLRREFSFSPVLAKNDSAQHQKEVRKSN